MQVKIRSSYGIGLKAEERRRLTTARDMVVELPTGARVDDLLGKLPALGPPEAFDDIMIHVFVNGRLRGFDHELQSGDVIDLHIPVSGG